MTCPCTKSLSEYVMLYVDDPQSYINADFIREHGVLVDFAERTQKLVEWNHVRETRIVYAFTIAEVFRLIEFEEGNKLRRPLHRILNEDREQIQQCLVSDESITIESLAQAARERFLARYDAGLAGTSETAVSR